MNHFSNKTLNGKWAHEIASLHLYIFWSFSEANNHFLLCIENWYEDKLALEQEYRKNPDSRIVS